MAEVTTRDPAQILLDSLVGEWRGSGVVQTPTTEPKEFTETMRFWRRNETVLDYWQRAWDADGKVMHDEVGIWRLGAPASLELTIALAGSTEVAEGAVTGSSLATTSTAVGRAATSVRFKGAQRRYHLVGDALDYDIDLESVNFPMSFHLRASLRKVAPSGWPGDVRGESMS